MTALLLEAIARDALGDQTTAGRALEQALDITAPGGIGLPLLLHSARALLERHRRSRATHPALICRILDLLTGKTRPAAPPGGQARRARIPGLR